MNDLARAIRRGGRSVVELPEGMEIDPGPVSVRRVGRTLVLETLGEAGAVAPGTYTSETLPPLSEGAKAILASVDAAVAKHPAAAAAKSGAAGGERGFGLDDEGQAGVALTDEGLPGLDPGA